MKCHHERNHNCKDHDMIQTTQHQGIHGIPTIEIDEQVLQTPQIVVRLPQVTDKLDERFTPEAFLGQAGEIIDGTVLENAYFGHVKDSPVESTAED
eukprot:CCRYP_002734-RC/>CCRYP_002734-RC protein AED:0.49 eAED:1.00 QI:0/0/0/1/0/0/2/0/95